MTYQVTYQSVKPQLFAGIRSTASPGRIAPVIMDLMGKSWEYIRAHEIVGGRNIALYRNDPQSGQVIVEAGVEVSQPFQGDGTVMCLSTPAGNVATVKHTGSYAGLGAAHAALSQHCKATGIRWEVYGHWVEDESRLVTDIYYLL